MKQILLISLLFFLPLQAQEPSHVKQVRLAHEGKKIASIFCDKSKLTFSTTNIDEIVKSISLSGACSHLSQAKTKALAYYLLLGNKTLKHIRINVPNGAKCPVCGMIVSKYPKWAAKMIENGRKHYFDGVKDMMKYYIFDVDFPYDRSKITAIKVADFYTLDAINAKDAYYVIGSKLHGPMGNEFIPFVSKESANNFIKDHGGKKIIRFKDITPKMVMGLDGVKLK